MKFEQSVKIYVNFTDQKEGGSSNSYVQQSMKLIPKTEFYFLGVIRGQSVDLV